MLITVKVEQEINVEALIEELKMYKKYINGDLEQEEVDGINLDDLLTYSVAALEYFTKGEER